MKLIYVRVVHVDTCSPAVARSGIDFAGNHMRRIDLTFNPNGLHDTRFLYEEDPV